MINAISGTNGLAVLIVLAVVATVWVLLTVRSSRPKNRCSPTKSLWGTQYSADGPYRCSDHGPGRI